MADGTAIPALPFCQVRLSARKPERPAYPKELKTLGNHIRRRRLDLGLLQREVAQQVGVDVNSVCHWETGHSRPKVYLMPRIIDFLGYVPGGPAASFSEALRTTRRLAGLSQARLARRARIDESSIAKWERGETIPFAATAERLRRFFKRIGQPLPEFGPEAFYGPERRAEAAHRGWHTKKSGVYCKCAGSPRRL
ncbi:MAG: helix-turn-helix domain-containing protein [Candidatus Binatia bacterium]